MIVVTEITKSELRKGEIHGGKIELKQNVSKIKEKN